MDIELKQKKYQRLRILTILKNQQQTVTVHTEEPLKINQPLTKTMIILQKSFIHQ